MKLKLSTAQIKDTIGRIETLKDDIEDASGQIVSDLVTYGGVQARFYVSTRAQSGIQKSAVLTKITENKNKGYIALYGENAVYDEFGTGEIGAQYSHPMKGRFSLNPYNSGPVVSQNVNKYGRHYWFYKPMSNTDYVLSSGYTEGIPAGCIMYNTAIDIRDESAKKNIIEKRLSYAIKRANSTNNK